MDKWNTKKLEEMTDSEPEYTKYNINFNYIAENLEEILIKTHENGKVSRIQRFYIKNKWIKRINF